MLFRKKIPRSCLYCARSTKLDKGQMLCIKHGVVSAQYQCRKFCYDPFKRVPNRPLMLDFSKYENDDFSL